MKAQVLLLGCAGLFVTACGDLQGANSNSPEGFIANVPEGVSSIAAPNQNLEAVRINPADGCYVYRYEGPVETTFLPLRTSNGNAICSRPPETQATS